MAPALIKSLVSVIGLSGNLTPPIEAEILFGFTPMVNIPDYCLTATVQPDAYYSLKDQWGMSSNWTDCQGVLLRKVCVQKLEQSSLWPHKYTVQANCPHGIVMDKLCAVKEVSMQQRRTTLGALFGAVFIIAWATWASGKASKSRRSLGFDEYFRCIACCPLIYDLLVLAWFFVVFAAGPLYMTWKIVEFLCRRLRRRAKPTTAATVPSPDEPPPPYYPPHTGPTTTPIQRPGSARTPAGRRQLRRTRRARDPPPAYGSRTMFQSRRVFLDPEVSRLEIEDPPPPAYSRLSGETPSTGRNDADDTNDAIPAPRPAHVRHGSTGPRHVVMEITYVNTTEA